MLALNISVAALVVLLGFKLSRRQKGGGHNNIDRIRRANVVMRLNVARRCAESQPIEPDNLFPGQKAGAHILRFPQVVISHS